MMEQADNHEYDREYEEHLAAEFHRCWDDFPGLARLIDARRRVLAANPRAELAGFVPGCVCAGVPTANKHKNCLMERALAAERGLGSVEDGLLRYWLPLADGCFVHLSLRVG
ncbi:MAG: hypothetical protein IJB55_04020 [Firmicutes bacterium]|nr:hypothetical protein [Bacillota bacterium]